MKKGYIFATSNKNIYKMSRTFKLMKALAGFIGRALGNIIIGLLRAIIQGLVLGYPLKWLWNDFITKGLLQGVITLTYWDAFKIILLISFLFRMSVTHRSGEENED